jgi:ParB-like chromosome segregation protein Spo0J
MSKGKPVKIEDLKVNLFVRKALNEDRVLELSLLIEHKVELDPIKITSDLFVIDGRHRIEAHKLLNRTEIEALIVNGIKDETDLIVSAYMANVGGALPPTQEDTEHTILSLLKRNVPKKKIGDMLNLPDSLARKYINEVQSKEKRKRISDAITAITEGGLTAAHAAEKYEVELESLKAVLNGHKRKQKRGVIEIQGSLTSTYRSLGVKNAKMLGALIEKFGDGDVTEKQVREIFDHFDELQKKAANAIENWKKRFEASIKK